MLDNVYKRIKDGRMTTRDFLKLGCGTFTAFMLGCDEDKEETPVASSSQEQEREDRGDNDEREETPQPQYADSIVVFSIDYPGTGARVDRDIITISGSGIKEEVGSFLVSVHTNDWYVQTGNFKLGSRGSWSYSPVYLRGQGSFNNHAIKAELIYMSGRTEVASVENIVRNIA